MVSAFSALGTTLIQYCIRVKPVQILHWFLEVTIAGFGTIAKSGETPRSLPSCRKCNLIHKEKSIHQNEGLISETAEKVPTGNLHQGTFYGR